MNSPIIKVAVVVLAFVASAASQGAERTSTPPNVMFDLSHFDLGLPVNSEGGKTGAAEDIKNKQLNGSPGYSSKYFYTDTDGAMVFYAPSNGATSTPGSGSDHTRSELRELYQVSGPTEWTNRIGGSMAAVCHVNQTAAKAGNTAVIGQIHGLSSVMMLLMYDAVQTQVVAKLYPTPNSTSTEQFVLATNVPLGGKITYGIQWIGPTLSISVNGHIRNWIVDQSWNNVPVYFKAGAYSSAPHTGNKPADATDVAFYRLQIQH